DERAERLTTLSRLTRLITSATDSAAAFHGIAEAATILLKAKMAYVWVDHGAETLREGGSFWAGPTLAGHIVPTVPVPRDQSIAGAVLTSCRPEYLEDVQRDPRWRHRALAETSDIPAFIALRDPGRDTLSFRQWPGARYEDYRSVRVAPGQGASGMVLATGRPFRTDRYLEDTRFGPEFQTVARIEGLHAYMAVPITIEDRVEGFLSVANRDDRLLTDRDEHILLQLADHAAVAIHNARLFTDNAARRREAEALTELGGAIASSLELEKILSLVVDRACALLGQVGRGSC